MIRGSVPSCGRLRWLGNDLFTAIRSGSVALWARDDRARLIDRRTIWRDIGSNGSCAWLISADELLRGDWQGLASPAPINVVPAIAISVLAFPPRRGR